MLAARTGGAHEAFLDLGRVDRQRAGRSGSAPPASDVLESVIHGPRAPALRSMVSMRGAVVLLGIGERAYGR